MQAWQVSPSCQETATILLGVILVGGTRVGGHEIRFREPVIYQDVGRERRIIPGAYHAVGNRYISFSIADYDKKRTLVIDPVLTYSTYLGGSSTDGIYGIAVDRSGNAYVTGITDSTDFPVTAGSFQTSCSNACFNGDVFVTKLDPTGCPPGRVQYPAFG